MHWVLQSNELLQVAPDRPRSRECGLRRVQVSKLCFLSTLLTQGCRGLRQGKPHTLTVLPRTQQGPPQPHPHPLRSVGRENRGPLQPQHQAAPHRQQQQEGERVMRTVYLPTANSDSLMLRIESLQAQLNEQVGFRGTLLESAVVVLAGASQPEFQATQLAVQSCHGMLS